MLSDIETNLDSESQEEVNYDGAGGIHQAIAFLFHEYLGTALVLYDFVTV